MGGAYERRQERFLARKALEQYPTQLQTYIDQPIASDIPISNVLWANSVLAFTVQKEQAFLKFWPQADIRKLDESTFVSIAGMLANKQVFKHKVL
ncbi:MAG: hypothetical protein R2822_22670 [Spirosomataceae bacterium]